MGDYAEFDPAADRLETIAPVIAVQAHDLIDRIEFWLKDAASKMALEASNLPQPEEWVRTTAPFLATTYIAINHGAIFTYTSRPVWTATSAVAQGLEAIQVITESLAREVHTFAPQAVEDGIAGRGADDINIHVDVPAALGRVRMVVFATLLGIVDDNPATQPTRRVVRQEDRP